MSWKTTTQINLSLANLTGGIVLRYSILVISAVLAITAAASAQITVTIGGGQNGYYYPHQRPVYYPNQGSGYYVNNNGCPPGQSYRSHPQYVRYENRKAPHRGKHKNRSRWAQQNQCPPRRF